MKKNGKIAWAMALIVALLYPFYAAADDFWDQIDFGVQPTSTPGVLGVDSRVYNARFTGEWNDGNSDQNFGATEVLAESVKLYDRKGNLVLESPDTVRTRDEVEEWARANASLIWDTIFGGNPSFPIGGSSDVVMNQASISEVVFDKIAPKRRQLEIDKVNNEFKASLEYLSVDINGNEGDALSALLGYAHELENGLNLGVLLPYRYTDMSDDINTNAHYAGLFLYAKKPVMTWEDLDLTWTVGGDIFGSAFYAQSDAISDMGTLKYGGGLFTSMTKYWSSVGVSFGADYKISDESVWDSVIDDDDEFVQEVIDWVNDLDPVGAFSYGINVGVPIFGEDAAVNVEAIRTHYISDDIDGDRDTQTVLGITFSYFPTDTFEITIGGRGTFELEDVEVYGITIGSIYRY